MEPRRRPQWLGERKPVLVRLPVEVAERLAEAAEQTQATLSGMAAELISAGLARRGHQIGAM